MSFTTSEQVLFATRRNLFKHKWFEVSKDSPHPATDLAPDDCSYLGRYKSDDPDADTIEFYVDRLEVEHPDGSHEVVAMADIVTIEGPGTKDISDSRFYRVLIYPPDGSCLTVRLTGEGKMSDAFLFQTYLRTIQRIFGHRPYPVVGE